MQVEVADGNGTEIDNLCLRLYICFMWSLVRNSGARCFRGVAIGYGWNSIMGIFSRKKLGGQPMEETLINPNSTSIIPIELPYPEIEEDEYGS